jgi:hypothetical protein
VVVVVVVVMVVGGGVMEGEGGERDGRRTGRVLRSRVTGTVNAKRQHNTTVVLRKLQQPTVLVGVVAAVVLLCKAGHPQQPE